MLLEPGIIPALKKLRVGVDLARQFGACRFEPIDLSLLAKIALTEGNCAEAIRIAEEAMQTCRDTDFNFAGPMTLCAMAVVTGYTSVREAA